MVKTRTNGGHDVRFGGIADLFCVDYQFTIKDVTQTSSASLTGMQSALETYCAFSCF